MQTPLAAGGGVNLQSGLDATIAIAATTLNNDPRFSYEARHNGIDRLSTAYSKAQDKEKQLFIANKENGGNFLWRSLLTTCIQMTAPVLLRGSTAINHLALIIMLRRAVHIYSYALRAHQEPCTAAPTYFAPPARALLAYVAIHTSSYIG